MKLIPAERQSGVRLRDLRDVERDDGRNESSVDELRAVAAAAQSAAVGFEVCAKRARSEVIAKRMTSLSEEARALAAAVAADVPGGLRRPSTSERMRWEWLASTGALIDGGAEGRLADEATRLLAIAGASASRLEDDALVRRLELLAASSRAAAA